MGLNIHAPMRHPTSRDLWVAAHPAPSDPSMMSLKNPSQLGFLLFCPPAVRSHRLPPKLLPVRVLGLRPQFPPQDATFLGRAWKGLAACRASRGRARGARRGQAGQFLRGTGLEPQTPEGSQRPLESSLFWEGLGGVPITRKTNAHCKEAHRGGWRQSRVSRCTGVYSSILHRLLPLTDPVRV